MAGAGGAPPNRLTHSHLKAFGGTESEDIVTWLAGYEILALNSGWQLNPGGVAQHDQRMERLMLYTVDSARNWVHDWLARTPTQDALGNPNPDRTWDNLRAAMIARFGLSPGTLMSRLMSRVQKSNESVSDFASALTMLQQQLNAVPGAIRMEDGLILQLFKNGIKEELAPVVLSHTGDNLQEAVDRARQIEERVRPKRRVGVNTMEELHEAMALTTTHENINLMDPAVASRFDSLEKRLTTQEKISGERFASLERNQRGYDSKMDVMLDKLSTMAGQISKIGGRPVGGPAGGGDRGIGGREMGRGGMMGRGMGRGGGRGFGGSFPGRGRGRPRCWRCGAVGHVAWECTHPKNLNFCDDAEGKTMLMEFQEEEYPEPESSERPITPTLLGDLEEETSKVHLTSMSVDPSTRGSPMDVDTSLAAPKTVTMKDATVLSDGLPPPDRPDRVYRDPGDLLTGPNPGYVPGLAPAPLVAGGVGMPGARVAEGPALQFGPLPVEPKKANKKGAPKKKPAAKVGEMFTPTEAKKLVDQLLVQVPVARLCQFHPELVDAWLKAMKVPTARVPLVANCAGDPSPFAVTTVLAKISGRRVPQAVVDSGASACVVSRRLLDDFNLVHLMEPGRGTYRDCNGVTRKPVGYVPGLPISVGQCTLVIPCHVVENKHLGLLLGVPWLAGAAVELHFGYRRLTPHIEGRRLGHVPISFTQNRELVEETSMQFQEETEEEDGASAAATSGTTSDF